MTGRQQSPPDSNFPDQRKRRDEKEEKGLALERSGVGWWTYSLAFSQTTVIVPFSELVARNVTMKNFRTSTENRSMYEKILIEHVPFKGKEGKRVSV